MFTALALTLAIGAPVPAPTAPVAAGTAPRVIELKPDANGKITLTVTRTEMQKVQVGVAIAGLLPAGAAPPPAATREVAVTHMVVVELGDVKDLAVTTADGKKLDKEEAIKKLAAGAIVVVSGDGKPVSPVFLKVFKDETLVLASPELILPQGGALPGSRPAMRPLPAAPGGIQIQPGVIQIQIAPGGAAVVPAVPLQPALPVAPPQPVPAAPVKPAAPVPPVAPAPVGK